MDGTLETNPTTGKQYHKAPDGTLTLGRVMKNERGDTYWSTEGELTKIILNGAQVAPAPPGAANVPITGPMDTRGQQKTAYEALPPGTRALRTAELVSRGAVDRTLDYATLPLDLSAAATHKMGLTGPGRFGEMAKEGARNLGTAISGPINRFTGSLGPEQYRGPLDDLATGTGKGIVDSLGFLRAAKLLAAAPKNTARRGVGEAMSEGKKMQIAAGGVGGAATELTDNPYVGMAASVATPILSRTLANIGRKMVTPAAKQHSPERSRVLDIAKEENIPMTAGQQTDSTPLKTLEGVFATLPLSSDPQMALYETQRIALNRAIMRRAGIVADDAAPETLERGHRQLGGVYDALAAKTTVRMDKQFFDDIDEVIKKYSDGGLPSGYEDGFKRVINDINLMRTAAGMGKTTSKGTAATTRTEVGPYIPENRVDVTMSGTQYQKVVSEIKARARATNDGEFRTALNRLASAMDGAMERTAESAHQAAKRPAGSNSGKDIVPFDPNAPHIVPPISGKALRQQWREINNQYRNLLTVEDAMMRGTADDVVNGNIPLGGFKSAVQSKQGLGYTRGKGDLVDLSRVGSLISASRVPNSGTPQRQYMQQLITGGVVQGGAVGGAASLGADAATTAAASSAALLGPRAAQKLYQSPLLQAYFKNTKLPPGPRQVKMDMLNKILTAQAQGQGLNLVSDVPSRVPANR